MARRRSVECDGGRTRKSSEERDKTEEGKRHPREEKRAKAETEVTRTAIVQPASEGYVSRKKWSTMPPTFSAIAGL